MLVLAMSFSSAVMAQIRTDASLGRPAQTLSGPAYPIPETLGKLSGNNLFHSFQTFNVRSGEAANFSTVTPGIAHVISRVTGGEASQINGKIQLSSVGATPDFYLINPAGVVFGAGAVLDVPGAFMVSTADSVKFPDGRFNADLNKSSTFSSAAPEAFGFLGATRGSITLKDGAFLVTQNAHPIGVFAGDVEISGATLATSNGGDLRLAALGLVAQDVAFTGDLPAATGTLALLAGGSLMTSTAGATDGGNIALRAGNIVIDRQGSSHSTGVLSATTGSGNGGSLEVSASKAIRITNGGVIFSHTSSAGQAGSVKVYAESIAIDDTGSSLTGGILSFANTGTGNAGNIAVVATADLALTNGAKIMDAADSSGNNTGNITVATGNLSLSNTSQIAVSSKTSGKVGTVSVAADNIAIDGHGDINTGIHSTAFLSTGNAGDVEVIAARNLTITNGGRISSDTSLAGNGGSVKVNAANADISGKGSGIFSEANPLSTGGGDIEVKVSGNLLLANGALISSSTYSSGKAGAVTVTAGRLFIDRQGGSQTGIISDTYDPRAAGFDFGEASIGDAGNVNVTASGKLALSNGGLISSSTFSQGKAGRVMVRADTLLVDGIREGNQGSQISAEAARGSSGQTGRVNVAANEIILSNGGQISMTNAASVAHPETVAQTSIVVAAPRLDILDSPNGITTSSTGNIAAGRILIAASDRLQLQGSAISTTSNRGNGGAIDITGGVLRLDKAQISTSVTGLTGNGGDIGLQAKALIFSSGFIQANTAARAAAGGQVGIDVSMLVSSGNTLFVGGQTPFVFQPEFFGFNVIQAVAPTGVSGSIQIARPILDLSGSLLGLSGTLIESGGLGRSPCQVSDGSSLSLVGRGGLPPSARGLLRSEQRAEAVTESKFVSSLLTPTGAFSCL